ncbi:MAG: heparan-alpha-glucosaminide N-acetyltransferase domain-containing protein [Promethearchaeota archaeon]
MKNQRLKSIDIFRGLCMSWMVLNHVIAWWVKNEFNFIHGITVKIIDPIGASGFLFIAGISVMLSHRRNLIKAKISEEYNSRMIKNAYFFRAFFIFIIAIFYNIPTAIALFNPSYIWTWFVLLTAAVSLFITWPLLRTSKSFRIFFGIGIIILHEFLVVILTPFKGDMNILGIIYHFIYHDINQDPILVFFPFFLFGTVIGDLLFDSYIRENHINNKKILKNKFIIPTVISGIILIIMGIILKFPDFTDRISLSWIIYSLGIDILLFSILLIFEEFIISDTKKSYKFLFYYSYYSLTIYLAHNILYFFFLKQLNLITIWFSAIGTFIFLGLLFRSIYKKWGTKASVKVQISRLSLGLTRKLEERLKNREKLRLNESKD